MVQPSLRPPRDAAISVLHRETAIDARGAPLDLAPIEPLLARIEEVYHPAQVWLFGSRARGDAGTSSDWDLLVVVDDDTDAVLLDPRAVWKMKRDAGVMADVLVLPSREFLEDRDTVNTLAHAVTREGVLLRER